MYLQLKKIMAKSKEKNRSEKNSISIKRLGVLDNDIGVSNTNDLSEDGSVVPVEKNELPVELPDDIDLNSQGNPLESHPK